MSRFDHAVYWEERLAGHTGLEGVGYLGLGQAFNMWMYRIRRGVFSRTVKKHLPNLKDRSVLDIGSGTGEYLRLWQQLGARSVNGSDLTATAVGALSNAFPGISVQRLDISAEHTDLDRYDAISCMDVLFHVVETDRFNAALKNIRASLKDGGVLFLSDNFVHQAFRHEEHFKVRTLANYETALSAHGLRIIERRPMFHLMNLPSDARSRWLHRWWSLVLRICRTSYALGGVLGAILYPLESLLVRLRREGVSTEIMVCVAA